MDILTFWLNFDVLAKAEVAELDVAVLADDEVVWLEVAVDVVQVVDGLDGQDGFRDVEAGHVFGEDVLLHQERHEVAALEIFHDEVQVIIILE